MLVSFDRLIVVKYAYLYRDLVTKHVYIVVMATVWVVVLVVDVLPFFPLGKPVDKEKCSYVIEHSWGISVTIAFNIIPFLVTIVNFVVLWRVASKITVRDHLMKSQLSRKSEYQQLDRYDLHRMLDLGMFTLTIYFRFVVRVWHFVTRAVYEPQGGIFVCGT